MLNKKAQEGEGKIPGCKEKNGPGNLRQIPEKEREKEREDGGEGRGNGEFGSEAR